MRLIKALGVICLLCIAITVNAERLTSQNWAVDLNGQTNEAHTANDSKSSFGIFCSGEKCLFTCIKALIALQGPNTQFWSIVRRFLPL